MATLGASDDGQPLRLGLLAGSDDGAGADGIDGDRFLDEAMLASLDGGSEMHRSECRRCGHQDKGAIRRHDLLVGVITSEEFRGREVVGLAQLLHAIIKGVTEGDDLRLDAQDFAGRDELPEGASTTTTATDEGDLDLGRHCVGTQDRRGGGQSEATQGHSGDEIATRDGVFHGLRL